MRWEDERYVRLYTRDTAEWLLLSFDAQALLMMLLRKVDRAGILPLGKLGRRAVAVVCGHAQHSDRIEAALSELLADGCVTIVDDRLVVPNFLEAQETVQSDAARKRAQRERDKAAAVTHRDQTSQGVTDGHEMSRAVTPSDPCLAVPNQISLLPGGQASESEAAEATEPQKRKPTYTADFIAQWSEYPRHDGKGAAFRAWKRQHPTLQELRTALKWQRQLRQWSEDGGRYIPHFATYLNQRRWEDEPPRDGAAEAEARARRRIEETDRLLMTPAYRKPIRDLDLEDIPPRPRRDQPTGNPLIDGLAKAKGAT